MIARAIEGSRSGFPEMENSELLRSFFALDSELGFMALLRQLNAVRNDVSTNKNVILMVSEGENLQVKTYRYATDAIRELFELEMQNPGKDIVLVRADRSDDVRIAFRNYFSDATEFIRLIDRCCEDLSAVRVSDGPK
jgi:putative GTP pyrophosphokinase